MSGNERSSKINDTFDWILYLFTDLKNITFSLKVKSIRKKGLTELTEIPYRTWIQHIEIKFGSQTDTKSGFAQKTAT